MYALKRYLVRGSLSWLLVCTLWIGATYMIDAVLVNPESPWHVVSQSGGVVTYSRPRWGGDAGLAMIGGFVMLGTGISALVWLVCALDFGVRCPECKDRTIVFDHRRESETREGASGMPYYVSVEIWEMCCPKCHRREKLLSKPSPNFP
jgi:hypothetical protein